MKRQLRWFGFLWKCEKAILPELIACFWYWLNEKDTKQIYSQTEKDMKTTTTEEEKSYFGLNGENCYAFHFVLLSDKHVKREHILYVILLEFRWIEL